MEYIKQNSGTTEHQIVEYLRVNKISSKLTTLKKIRQLKQKNEITDSLKEGESGFHNYSINEDSDFNRINRKLSEIEVLINHFEKYENFVKQSPEQKYRSIPIGQLELAEGSYLVTLTTLLIRLLGQTTEVIRSENDSQILYRKITQLLYKLYQTTEGEPVRLLDPARKTFQLSGNEIRSTFSKFKVAPRSRKIEENLADTAKKLFENLEKITVE